jgi:hypothetical protein
MSDLATKIAAQCEETKRVNTEHDLAVLLAPKEWIEFKSQFTEECDKLSRHGSATFRCHEPDETRLQIQKIVRGTAYPAIEFTFHPSVPAISSIHHFDSRSRRVLEMKICGSHLLFSSGNAGVILSYFIQECMIPLVGW